jgi:hypothetical protein
MLIACDGGCGREPDFIGVSMVASMAYAWGFAREMTKMVICEEVFLRRCEMMLDPSVMGRSQGIVVKYSRVIFFIDVS